MSRRMHGATVFLFMTFAAILLPATAADAGAAELPAAPATRAQQLQELDEIWVRGKRLSEVIEDAEDEFFELYNKINRNHDYDVFCGYMNLSRASLAMTRTCMPGFYVYNYLDLAGRAVPSCSSYGSTYIGGTGGFGYAEGAHYAGSYYAGCTHAPMPSPELLALSHREPYRRNVMKIIGSDERLRNMATRLAGLYGEMEVEQGRYVGIKDAQKRLRAEERARKKSAGRAPDLRVH